MHNDFADWFRSVSIQPRAEELTQRWEAVQSFADDATADEMLDLARLFYGHSPQSNEMLEKFRAAFKKTDQTFPMRNNDAELAVLAGACLVDLFRFDSGWDILAASMLVASGARGVRKAPVPEIPNAALHYLTTKSRRLRIDHGGDVTPLSKSEFSGTIEVAKKAIASHQPGPSADAISAAFSKLSDQLVGWTEKMALQQRLRREESDVLWWVLSKTSRTFQKPLSELSPAAASLVVGRDLAELVLVLPGPLSAPALLATVLGFSTGKMPKGVALSDYVEASPIEWRKATTAGFDRAKLAIVCPLHTAMQRSSEQSNKELWFAETHVDASKKVTPLDAALQFYDECLLIRALKQQEGE